MSIEAGVELSDRCARRSAVLFACALAAATIAPSFAVARDASPLLPPASWAVDAADRLEALGLVEAWMPAQKAVRLAAVSSALEAAEMRATASRADLLPLIRAWRDRLALEFPGTVVPRRLVALHVGAAGAAGDAHELAPRVAPDALHAVDTGHVVTATAAAAFVFQETLGVLARTTVGREGIQLTEGEVAASVGPWSLSVGRAQSGFGFSPLGGVMLSGGAMLDRIELMSTEAVRLPSWLRRTGRWTVDTFVARLRGPLQPGHPLLWATSVRWRLHPRLTVGVQRGMIFGGEPWRGFPFSHRVRVLAGIDNYRENNMLSLSARWRLPSDAALPLTATIDWGTDDDPLTAAKIPGVVAGINAPMLGALPAAIGIEAAFFGRVCCRPEWNSQPWYIHDQYPGGWTTGAVALGDRLGGNGRALRAHTAVDFLNARLRVASAVWVQDRFSGNLFSPQLGGRSVGLRGGVELHGRRGALTVQGSHETGRTGWHVSEGRVQATSWF